MAPEVARRCHQQGKHDGELAIEVGGDVQPPGDAHNCPPVAANGVETIAQLLRLARFAVVQRDGVVVFADADQAETEVRLVPFLIEAQHDQRFADPPDQQRSQHRIQQRKPHHITGQRDGVLAEREGHRPADVPQDVDKGKQRHQAGEQPERQRQGILGQHVEIFGDTLIGVIDDLLLLGVVIRLVRQPFSMNFSVIQRRQRICSP